MVSNEQSNSGKGRVLALICALAALLSCSSEQAGELPVRVQQAVFGGEHFGEQNTLTLGSTTSLVASTALTSARLVSAFKRGTTTTGKLTVVLSRLFPDAGLGTLHEFETTHSIRDKVAVARVDDYHFIVAARDSSGKLSVVSFLVNGDDQIEEADSAVRSAITEVAMVSLNASPGHFAFGSSPSTGPASEGHVMITTRSGNGALALVDYSVNDAGLLRENGSLAAGAVPAVGVAYVPGSQPVGAWHSRSSATTERSTASCTDGVDNDDDGYVDCNDWDCCGTAACDGGGACVQGTVVTATRNNSTSTKLISWQASAQGTITRTGDTLTGPADSVAITAQSFQRIALVRSRDSSSQVPVVSTWDVADGTFVEHSSANVGVTASVVRLVNGGGARLFLQASDATGNGYLSTFDAIDQIRETDRLILPAQSWDKSGDLLSLSQDRAVLTFPDGNNAVEMTAYRDFSHPLVRGSFQFASPDTSTAGNNSAPFALLSPATPLAAEADASLAVGGNFVLACGNGDTTIYDKTGRRLGRMDHASELFRSVRYPTITDALGNTVVNQNSINRHLAYQHACNGNGGSSVEAGHLNACTKELYDTDCTFDETTQRFIITSATRYRTSERLQRYLAIAVSKETDPRRGFNVYTTTDDKYGDNPAIATSSGMLVFTHQAGRQTQDFDSYQAEVLAPSALVFSIADLSASTPEIRTTKISTWQTGNTTSLVTANVRGTFGDYGAVYRGVNGGTQLYVFPFTLVGPAQVVTDTAHVVPVGRGKANAWLQLDDVAPMNRLLGKFYVASDYTSGGVGRVHVGGADVTIQAAQLGPSISLQVSPLPTVGDALACGGNFDCKQSSVAYVIPQGQTTGKVYLSYYRYGHNYQQCSAGITCSSGVCIDDVCQPLFDKPAVYFSRFDAALNPLAPAGTNVVEGARPAPAEAVDQIISNAQAIGDPTNRSVWSIYAVPNTSGWTYALAQYR